MLIESALWDPGTIAQTGRKLGINTDARYRFERGVDPAFCVPGLDLATALVLELCGGTPSDLVLAGAVPEPDHAHRLSLERGGAADRPRPAAVDDMRRSLERLGFALAERPGNGDRVLVRVPSWRPDVDGKADLVEEVVRHGRPRPGRAAAAAARSAGVPAPVLTLLQKRTRLAKRSAGRLRACSRP